MSRVNKSVSFGDDLLNKDIEDHTTCTPLVHSEIALSATKSRIPVKLREVKIKKCLLKQEAKLTLKTRRDLVINLPEQLATHNRNPMKISVETRTRSTTSVTERKKTCPKEEQNPQELFKTRVPRAGTKYEHLCRSCKFHHVNAPRSYMPMVVIDFDALILKLTKENIASNKQSILDLFANLYPYYNIGTWSSLNMKDFVKLLEDHKIFEQDSFNLCFCLDNSSLISAFVPSVGSTKVKALQIVWTFYPQFHQNNSVFIDEGLKTIVFKHYGVAVDGPKKEPTYIQESQIQLFSEYLIWFFRAGKIFSTLNRPTWKLSWNEKF